MRSVPSRLPSTIVIMIITIMIIIIIIQMGPSMIPCLGRGRRASIIIIFVIIFRGGVRGARDARG